MSRIHEALKKAEQERDASKAGPLDQPPEPAAGPPRSPTLVQDAAPETARLQIRGGTGPDNPYTLDEMLAQSTRPQWQPDARTMLFFNPDEDAPGTEQFRILQLRLNQMRETMPLKKILVTSALPQEGRSFVAANLAQAMVRQPGRRALLIDADLRGPRLHTALGTIAGPGLTDYLRGEGNEFSIMQQGAMENLFFIPGGRGVSSPVELLASGKLKILLQRVESLFDWIIIDSPPAVAMSDASLLATLCDGVLMVVRSNTTPFDIAKKARQEFEGKTLLGVVLNGVEIDSSYGDFYGAAYQKKTAQESSVS
ncbi:MAG TPA: CpsD/CapB family tyrosine-protein kinase [Terriglobales bacterium]|nr:CpsD/CapB family tyrosine-protein kinase [Terriglobales bacterium]